MKNAVWLITGCSRGLGRDLARVVLQRGYLAAVTARDEAALAPLRDEFGDRCLPLRLDVIDQASVAAAVARAEDHFGRIDVVVNNAGYAVLGAVEEINVGAARGQMDTNFFGPLQVIHAVLPGMRKAGRGHIFNVSSVGGFVALPACGQYSATKFALEGLSEALALEVAPLGIRVTIVEPNGFRTDFLSARSMRTAAIRIAAYQPTSGVQLERFAAAEGKQPSDPVRGSNAIVDAFESEQPPLRLVLGRSGVDRIRQKLAAVEAELAQWEAISASVAFE